MKKIYEAELRPTNTVGEYAWTEASKCENCECWDGDIIGYLLNLAADEDEMRDMINRPYVGSIHNLPSDAVVLTDENGVPLEIDWAVENTPKKISLDNGNSFMDADEALETENVNWNEIVSFMDDDIREEVCAELTPCTNKEFLERYLQMADEDLIIG